MSVKKYQIFVSSTFDDLKIERNTVAKSILDLSHIPIGMEMFPASSTEQLKYIKRIIDECDYYVLILGARYGSEDSDGVSYTEREFEYAVAKEKQILTFVHRNPDELPVSKTDRKSESKDKLDLFRMKIIESRVVSYWGADDSLEAKVIIALTHAFRDFPQIGWVRNDQEDPNRIRDELLEAKRTIDELQSKLAQTVTPTTVAFANPVGLDSLWELKGETSFYERGEEILNEFSVEISLRDFLKAIAISLLPGSTLAQIVKKIEDYLVQAVDPAFSYDVDSFRIEEILIQLIALNLVRMTTAKDMTGSGNYVWFLLTDLGKNTWLSESYRKS